MRVLAFQFILKNFLIVKKTINNAYTLSVLKNVSSRSLAREIN